VCQLAQHLGHPGGAPAGYLPGKRCSIDHSGAKSGGRPSWPKKH
jgi:hypothetical protein